MWFKRNWELIDKTILPSGLESMSISKLIELRKRFEESRNEFRSTVSKFIDYISKIDDKDFAKDISHINK